MTTLQEDKVSPVFAHKHTTAQAGALASKRFVMKVAIHANREVSVDAFVLCCCK